jgi:hypothetical protein
MVWDSLSAELPEEERARLAHLGNFIVEHIQGFHAELEWEFVECIINKQSNTSDCGLFALQGLIDFIRYGKVRSDSEPLAAGFLRYAYVLRLLGFSSKSRPREVEEGEEYPVWELPSNASPTQPVVEHLYTYLSGTVHAMLKHHCPLPLAVPALLRNAGAQGFTHAEIGTALQAFYARWHDIKSGRRNDVLRVRSKKYIQNFGLVQEISTSSSEEPQFIRKFGIDASLNSDQWIYDNLMPPKPDVDDGSDADYALPDDINMVSNLVVVIVDEARHACANAPMRTSVDTLSKIWMRLFDRARSRQIILPEQEDLLLLLLLLLLRTITSCCTKCQSAQLECLIHWESHGWWRPPEQQQKQSAKY